MNVCVEKRGGAPHLTGKGKYPVFEDATYSSNVSEKMLPIIVFSVKKKRSVILISFNSTPRIHFLKKLLYHTYAPLKHVEVAFCDSILTRVRTVCLGMSNTLNASTRIFEIPKKAL
ncbi:hypothetical protein NPIL_689621 [Nephila pilipes]|uniref:Uncharacterized protein n=1 Tax=Nephila pilipes TaxID=299642 RepID=A0A8X6UIJ7_NEPPI|nr:hypothetical protein NPIL_689621 [Nephila pilipes]